MRLRANIEEIITLSRIAQTIQALTKVCILRFEPETLHIIVTGGNNDGGVQVWSRIKNENVFSEIRVVANANNEINMEVPTSLLAHALKAAASSQASGGGGGEGKCIMRLAKKNERAVLCFEIEAMSAQRKKVKIVHDVQVTIMRVDDVKLLKEPECPNPDVYIYLPPLQKMRTVVESMSKMSNLVGVSATRDGALNLKIQTDVVALETGWTGCPNPAHDYEEDPERTEEEGPVDNQFFHAIVSVKSFSQFLSSHSVSVQTIAAICQNHCLIMYVYVVEGDDRGGVLTFYIPAKLV